MSVIRRSQLWWCVPVAVVAAMLSTGCPRRELAPAKVYVLLSTGGSGLVAKVDTKAPLDLEEIESLIVTVTEVALHKASDDDSDDVESGEDEDNTAAKDGEEGEDGEDGEGDGWEVVLSEPMDVELMDLTGLSALIGSGEIPPGTYTKIRLAIENARLKLASDPETEITDVQLTANGHLFVSEHFEVAEGETRLLALDLGGIHLVETGSGKYVLTPQLRAEIDWVEADATLAGTIVSVDTTNDTMVVALNESEDTEATKEEEGPTEVTVYYAGATILLPETETEEPPAGTKAVAGTEEDLVVGSEVSVLGVISENGSMTANEIQLLAPEEPEEPPAET